MPQLIIGIIILFVVAIVLVAAISALATAIVSFGIAFGVWLALTLLLVGGIGGGLRAYYQWRKAQDVFSFEFAPEGVISRRSGAFDAASLNALREAVKRVSLLAPIPIGAALVWYMHRYELASAYPSRGDFDGLFEWSGFVGLYVGLAVGVVGAGYVAMRLWNRFDRPVLRFIDTGSDSLSHPDQPKIDRLNAELATIVRERERIQEAVFAAFSRVDYFASAKTYEAEGGRAIPPEFWTALQNGVASARSDLDQHKRAASAVADLDVAIDEVDAALNAAPSLSLRRQLDEIIDAAEQDLAIDIYARGGTADVVRIFSEMKDACDAIIRQAKGEGEGGPSGGGSKGRSGGRASASSSDISYAEALQVFGFTSDPTPEEASRRRNELAKREHPDQNPGEEEAAKKRMQRINVAYDVIRDELARRKRS